MQISHRWNIRFVAQKSLEPIFYQGFTPASERDAIRYESLGMLETDWPVKEGVLG